MLSGWNHWDETQPWSAIHIVPQIRSSSPTRFFRDRHAALKGAHVLWSIRKRRICKRRSARVPEVAARIKIYKQYRSKTIAEVWYCRKGQEKFSWVTHVLCMIRGRSMRKRGIIWVSSHVRQLVTAPRTGIMVLAVYSCEVTWAVNKALLLLR